MDITEIISLLDELRGKATQGEWEYSEYGAETNDDVLIMQKTRTGKRKEDWIVIPSVNDGDASCITENKNIGYIVALHNALPALRQAALDGERYRKAGETLEANLGEHAHTSGMFPEKDCFVCDALTTYHEATKPSDV